MSDALAKAFAGADRSYHAAKQAVGAAPTPSVASGGMVQRTRLGAHAEQYREYRGWQFVAVRAIAQRAASQELNVGTVNPTPRKRKDLHFTRSLPRFLKRVGDSVEPIPGHAMVDAFANPAPWLTGWTLMYSTVASLELTGKAHIWLRETRDGIELLPIPSHWIQPIHTEHELFAGWKIRPPGQAEPYTLPGEDVCYISLPDPSDPLGAVGPLQSQSRAVNTDEAIQVAQEAAFKNGIFPKYALRVGKLASPDVPRSQWTRAKLTGAQRSQLIESVRKFYGGARNANEPLILDAIIEGVDKLTTSPHEMDFLDSGASTRSRILQAFGVSGTIVGEIGNANRAQAVVAENTFCQNVVNPLLSLLGETFTKQVAPRFASDGQRLAAWFSPAEAHDEEMVLEKWRTALQFGCATGNEYRVHVLNIPESDDVMLGAGAPVSARAQHLNDALESMIFDSVQQLDRYRELALPSGNGDGG